jgi:hypothetical protein
VLVYPAVLGGRVLAPEDILLFQPPLQSVRPAGLLHPSNYLLPDAVEVFHPDLQWARSMLRGGHLPLWDPDIFAGWPLLASQQTALLFPLTFLAYALPFWFALGLIVVLKVFLAAWGVWLLCRALGLRAAPAWLGAVSYGLGTYFVVWLDHPQTSVWLMLPWLVLAVRRVTRRGDRRSVALLAAAVGLTILGGHPESVVILGLLVLGFAAQELIGRGRAVVLAGSRRRTILRLLAGVVLGGLCGLVVLAPFVEQLGQSVDIARGGTNLPNRALLSLFLPDLWGRPDSGVVTGGPLNYAERTIYVGALPLLLALAGLWGARRREQWFLAAALLGALVLAVHVPGLGGLPRLPLLVDISLPRALVLASFCLAVLAAYGLESFLDGDPRHRRRMLQIATALALLPVAWAAARTGVLGRLPVFGDLAPSLWGGRSTGRAGEAAALTRWILAAAGGLGLLLLLGRGRGRGRRRVLVLVALLAWCTLDLEALDHGYQPAISQTAAQPPPTPSLIAARAVQGHGRVAGLGRYLVPNVGQRYGLRDVRGHELPANLRYRRLFAGLGGSGFQATRLYTNAKTGRLLDAFGAGVFMTGPTLRPALPELRLVAASPDGRVYRNTTALPRAYLASDWRPVADRPAALAATLRSTTAQLRSAPVLEGAPAAPARAPSGGSSVGYEIDRAGEVKLGVSSRTGGYLVLLDSYYPGWRATVDGRGVPIRAANEAFRAVAVPAGRHEVDFRYRPATILLGGLVSLIAWVVVLLAAIVPSRRAHRPPPGPGSERAAPEVPDRPAIV